jgi:hypothetical protein
MNAWRVANRSITVGTFISVKAFTDFWCRANSIDAALAYTHAANGSSPSSLTITLVGCSTNALYTRRRSDWDSAVETCPAKLTLTALSFIFIVLFETLVKVCQARSLLLCV